MKITIARIYITEAEHLHSKIFERLHDEHKVKGVTMFRGVAGFGESGATHSSSLLDMSFDMPIVVEFFDEDEQVRTALESLSDLTSSCRVITFAAESV